MSTSILSSETQNVVEQVVRERLRRRNMTRPVTEGQVCDFVTSILDEVEKLKAQRASGARPFESITMAVRGLAAMKGMVFNPETKERDLQYAKSLNTANTPGTYLSPVYTARGIIEGLTQYATARVAGAKIWPITNKQTMNVPNLIVNPTFVWAQQNSRVLSSDMNAGQLVFELKNCTAIESIPLQLFRDTTPEWDALMADAISSGLADAEDFAMHSSATLSADAPKAIMSAGGITLIKSASGNNNGGPLAYTDTLAVLQKAIDLKVKPPYCWFSNGRTALRTLSLYDTTSRPLFVFSPQGIGPAIGTILGWPVFATASIPVNEAVGSGSSLSHLLFCNPKSINIAESNEVSIAVSDEMAFDSGDVVLRIAHKIAFDYSNTSGIIALIGIS